MTCASKHNSPALYDQPGFLLRRAHQLAVSIFEAQLGQLSATPAQIAVLTMLRSHPSLHQSELARAIGLDKATVSVLVKGDGSPRLAAAAAVPRELETNHGDADNTGRVGGGAIACAVSQGRCAFGRR